MKAWLKAWKPVYLNSTFGNLSLALVETVETKSAAPLRVHILKAGRILIVLG
jgi:hypothetical protein